MNTKHFESVFELAKTRNFNRAAENLYITQPALTYQINVIEEEIGFRLFDRSGKGAELTPAGEQFLATLHDIDNQLKRAIEQGQNFAFRYRDNITIGMSVRSAAVVSGIIWGLWHAPAIAMGHNYGMSYVGFPIAGILTMVIACTALGSMMCYLRVKTGSVWPCALAHGAVNAIANIGVVFCTAGASILGPSPLGLVAGIPVIVLGIVLWLRMSPARVA